MENITIKSIKSDERFQVEGFLSKFDLSLDKDVEYTIAALVNNEIVGTCSYAGNVLKCFAVSNVLRGEGITAMLITELTNILFNNGIYETFIFTKPKNIRIFEGLGYSEVYKTQGVALLEGGMANVNRYVDNMYKKSGLSEASKVGIVMNCNPFTLGHRYLIESAARENEEVVIFIVEENRSLFPFETRLDLVKRGTADLKNVHVIPGGNYIISSNTFPSYFLKQEDERLNAYTSLDAGIFGKYIAPKFNIKKRYIGTEPMDRVTNAYNKALLQILPSYGIEVKLMERLESDGRVISASEVRRLMQFEKWDEIRKVVPSVTYEFLKSNEAVDIINKIKGSMLKSDK